MLRNVIDQDDKAVTIESIQKYISDYYQLKVGRAEVAKQLEVDRDASPDRDVPVQVTDHTHRFPRSAEASAGSITRP